MNRFNFSDARVNADLHCPVKRERLFSELYLAAFRYALTLTNNEDLSEHLTQEVLTNVCEKYQAKSFVRTGTADFLNYVLVSVKNRFINYYNRKQKYNHLSIDDEDYSFLQPSIPASDSYLVYDDLFHQLQERVPEMYFEAWRLKRIEGLKYEEVAKEMNIPVGTVRSRDNTARRIMLQYMHARE